jgi:hypothetical protein
MTSYTFGGTALTSFGKVTVLNDYLDTADRRGDNKMIPFRHGKIFSPKYYDERTISMGIAMSAGSAGALETTFDNMRSLFSQRTEGTLIMTREDSSTRYIMASVNKSLQVDRKSAEVALAVVQFDCASPFWRLTSAITDNTTAITASPNAMTVTNPGSIEERDCQIVIHGAFTAITITNSTNGASLTYTGAIGTAETVTISTINGEYSAVLSTGSANVIGNVTHSGSACLLPINVGANTLAITSTGKDANSTVKITFNAPYL